MGVLTLSCRSCLVAVQAGQHYVQDDDVVGRTGDGGDPLIGFVDYVNCQARLAQPALHAGRQAAVILDQQNSHEWSMGGNSKEFLNRFEVRF